MFQFEDPWPGREGGSHGRIGLGPATEVVVLDTLLSRSLRLLRFTLHFKPLYQDMAPQGNLSTRDQAQGPENKSIQGNQGLSTVTLLTPCVRSQSWGLSCVSQGVEQHPNTQPPPSSSKRHETSVGRFTMMSPGDGKKRHLS